VFADEPTGNLDTVSGHELLDLLRGSVRNIGQTVVMVTHDPIAASYADEVLLLRDGQLAGVLPNPRPDTVLAALSSLSGAGGRNGRPVAVPQDVPPRAQDTGPMPAQFWDPPHAQFAGPPVRQAGA
jgi:energy-coupling factor transporter ATP-binding protein EcfA2